MDEFSLIDVITGTLDATTGAPGGVGDDAAILEVSGDKQLVVSVDTLLEGVHFEHGIPAADIGYKALAVNLSDLAAMGARPEWFFLALTLPSLDAQWAREFSRGLKLAAEPARIVLAGGDTTRGPLSITITVVGLVDSSVALLRSGARPGDIIGISGVTGLAGLALRELKQGRIPEPACLQALRRPVPRLALGQALAGLASSCIDVSDGLLADLTHIATASGVGLELSLEKLPCPPELAGLPVEDRWNLQLGGGDDYELGFTCAPEHWENIRQRAHNIGVDVTKTGAVVAGSGCKCIGPDGQVFEPRRAGYNHGSRSEG